MIKKRRKQLIQYYSIGDIAAVCISFIMTFYIRFHSGLVSTAKGVPEFERYISVLAVLIGVHLVYFSFQGFYKIKLRRNRLDDLFLLVVNSFISVILILMFFSYLESYNFIDFEVSHWFAFIYIPVSVIVIFTVRMLIFFFFRRIFLKKNGVSRILIAGAGEMGVRMAESLGKYSHFGIEVAGFLSDNPSEHENVIGRYSDLESVATEQGITDLFIALPLTDYSTTVDLIDKGNNLYLDIKLVPDILQIASLKAGLEHVEGIPTINLGDIALQGHRLLGKRLFDILFSLTGLIVCSPFFLILALLVKITSKGPVFYSQTRVGLDGKNFKMIKFRTMVQNAEEKTGAIWSPPNDSRVTRIGGFLRKFSLDEVPQLFNVLKGEMSLVGPRPERPELVAKFKEDIPKYMLRHRVRTGMTGWAQVHGLRGNTSLYSRIEYDIYYIQNWSFKLDLQILWRTILKFQFIDTSGGK